MAQKRYFEITFDNGSKAYEIAHTAADVLFAYGVNPNQHGARAKAGKRYDAKPFGSIVYAPITEEAYTFATSLNRATRAQNEATEAPPISSRCNESMKDRIYATIPAQGRKSRHTSLFG